MVWPRGPSYLAKNLRQMGSHKIALDSRTEVTDEVCFGDIWCPFSVGDVSILMHVETESLKTFAELF